MLAFHEFCTPDERQEISNVLSQLFVHLPEGTSEIEEWKKMFVKWKRLAVDPTKNYLQIKNKVHSRDEGGAIKWCLNVFYEDITYHVYVRRHCLFSGTMIEKPGLRQSGEHPYEMLVKTENVVSVFDGSVTWIEHGEVKNAKFW